MILRSLTIPLHRAVQREKTVLLQGPRSAGKTTLLRREFPGHRYLSMDEAADRERARRNPPEFLARLRGQAVIDDLHRAPELVEHLAATPDSGPLILASSRRLRLPAVTFELYPATRAERELRTPLALEMLGRFVPAAAPVAATAAPWPLGRRFVESDVRDLVNVHDLDRFESFVRLAQAHSGEVLDQQALANESGVAHRTVARWLNVLADCFLTLRLAPSDFAYGRRLVRSPKLHFLTSDCFESQVVGEIYANACHAGAIPDLRYWRDSNGFEIPLVVQLDTMSPMPVGIAAMPNPTDESRLRRWMALAGVSQAAMIAQRGGAGQRGGVLRYALGQL